MEEPSEERISRIMFDMVMSEVVRLQQAVVEACGIGLRHPESVY